MKLQVKISEWSNVNKSARIVEQSLRSKKIKKAPVAPECVYIMQVVGKETSQQERKLACLCSNQIIQLYDQQTLKLVNQIEKPHGSDKRHHVHEIGYFKQSASVLFTCGEDGRLKGWDLRESLKSSSFCFDYSIDVREFICADVNSSDMVISVGTNKAIDDVYVYLFDVRNTHSYVHRLCESHSDDVTQCKFDPVKSSRLASASLDGLVCLYDLDQQLDPEEMLAEKMQAISNGKSSKAGDNDDDDEDDNEPSDPDLIEQVFNGTAAIQKIGFLSSDASNTLYNQIYAINYLNELIIWDLNSHDQIHKWSPSDENEYYVDCLYAQLENRVGLVKCMGNKQGAMKLVTSSRDYTDEISLYDTTDENARSNENTMSRTSHRDIIRSVHWNWKMGEFFTAGEDGFLLKWQMTNNLANLDQKNDLKSASRQHEIVDKRKHNDDNDTSDVIPTSSNQLEKKSQKKSRQDYEEDNDTDDSNPNSRKIYFNKKYFN